MGMSSYVMDQEEAAAEALVCSIADYLDSLAALQPSRTAKRALLVASANVRAGLFESTGAARGQQSRAVVG